MQAAIRESRGGTSLSRATSAAVTLRTAASSTPKDLGSEGGGGGHAENGLLANGGPASGSSTPLLAEGTETALLYVRFRAVAEPGLKGELAVQRL